MPMSLETVVKSYDRGIIDRLDLAWNVFAVYMETDPSLRVDLAHKIAEIYREDSRVLQTFMVLADLNQDRPADMDAYTFLAAYGS